jgi:riboflavin kinase / FMN adenylyltransferase
MNVARSVAELESVPRAVAVGSFDGVHLGHRRVLQAALDAGLRAAVVTFYPHPRTVLGNRVDLLATLDRRLELLDDAGVEDTLVLEFTLELAQYEPEDFAERVLRPIGTEIVVAGDDFRFGQARRGDLALLERLGFGVRRVPLVEGVSSTRIRELLRAGEIEEAARMLGRAAEVDGVVVAGDARGGTLGYPTANLRVEPQVLVPEYGIYAGSTAGRRAAVSIGVNPHYGGTERRVEVFLLDFEGDLYGERLVVELWERLRDERAFPSEGELVKQIADDVERTRRARPPVVPSKE